MPWPAIVLSETLERYVRAEQAVQSLGFTAAWLPAVMPPAAATDHAWAHVGNQRTGRGCPLTGENGLRVAHRNAWKHIAMLQTPMAVFEDDVVATTGNVEVVDACLKRAQGYDVAFLSEGPAMLFATTAALWVTPRAARWLLHNTSVCQPSRHRGIDHNVALGCRQRLLHCLHAVRHGNLSDGGGRYFGVGVFVQDRVGVRPYLHQASNRQIGRGR